MRRAAEQSDWQVVSAAAWTGFEQLIAKQDRYDAAFVDLFNFNEALQLKDLSKKIVELSNVFATSPFPRVHSDDYEIGRIAAQHLCDTGARQLVFFGVDGHQYSDLRKQGFVETLARLGRRAPKSLHLPANDNSPGPFILEVLNDWLAKQSGTLGIFCCNDSRLLFALQAIHATGLEPGRDVMLVGVDCEPLAVELFGDHFAFIQQDLETIGMEAAACMAALTGGSGSVRPLRLIPPKALIYKKLPAETAVNKQVKEACQWLRDHVADAHCIDTLAKQLGVSKRSLERKFQATLGHGPKTEHLRIRVAIAREKLETTDESLVQISTELGFADQRQLSRLFRQFHHETPAAYRRSRRVLS